MKFSKFLMFTLLCSVLILSACGEDETVNANKNEEIDTDLSEYPIGVQNEDISVEYYNILMNTFSQHLDISEDVKGKSEVEEKKDLYREYLLYLSGLKYRVSNDNEQEIDNYFSSFLFNAKLWAESRIDHLDTQSDIDNSVSNNYFTDAKNDMLMTMEIMEKYDLSD